MRFRSNIPAQQLRSTAARYCCALAPLPLVATKSWWRNTLPIRPEQEVPEEAAEDTSLARLEAVLLLAREPLSSRKLSQHANLADGTQARTLIRQLNDNYDRAGRAFRVEEVAGGYQLLTRRKFASWLRRLGHVPPETRLSAPALETLAVIAYRQPVLRADIEAIRGVNCGEILRQLMERDLVRIGGRSEELGRPYLYATTKRFLQVFGLVSLEDLPRAAAIRSAPVLAALPAAAAGFATDWLSNDDLPMDEAELAANPSGEQDELHYTTD